MLFLRPSSKHWISSASCGTDDMRDSILAYSHLLDLIIFK
jgi:hypothetical protein